MKHQQILELNYANGLDGGGYSFENPPKGLKGLGCAVYTDPDPDYVPWCCGTDSGSARHAFYGLSCPVYAFAPNSGHFAATLWPESFKDKAGDTMVKVRDGRLTESDTECHCHGELENWTGAAGEPNKALGLAKLTKWIGMGWVKPKTFQGRPKFYWNFTGNSSDKPHPDCPRCDGTGYVTFPAGEWALYALKDEDDSALAA